MIINHKSPVILKESITMANQNELSTCRADNLNLRNRVVPKTIVEKFQQLTFSYFFDKLKKNLQINDYGTSKDSFKKLIIANMHSNFLIFVRLFARFDIYYRTYNFKIKNETSSDKINKSEPSNFLISISETSII